MTGRTITREEAREADRHAIEVLGICVEAAETMTFILPKAGFSKANGPEMCGRVAVADIGVPPPE
jgi:NAD(P)H-hydrate repair Nnr-like enzyme with NAD(P)H-hydrate epimerase domain